ncbi:DUF6065 family protein [Roseomonas sp. GC11]|uniref:DUF6065 family protein n=1 Tax=Roseomonas sp. GC11 TaxID=2950546 RepID=UPI002108D265|nr:DUF6065 family protein [Roseomonas sp. GC11]MCQ4161914.1 DUF6065 family protein [Roseomonas sp. GC11]
MADEDPPRLIAYQLDHPMPPLRPGSVRRAWMDATREGFAYRCLPLTIANGHGWEIQGQTGFEAWWTGGSSPGDVVIRVLKPGALAPSSHFGAGVLTFAIPTLLRTPPGIGLWVGGPPNAPKDGIAPLTGVVETDWAPMTFTMNWRFTRPDHVVRFRPGEPIGFFFPLPLGLAEAMRPEIRPLAADPPLAEAHRAWCAGRRSFNAGLKEEGSAERRQGWQRHYHQGVAPGGEAAPDHRTRIRVRPFPPPPRSP